MKTYRFLSNTDTISGGTNGLRLICHCTCFYITVAFLTMTMIISPGCKSIETTPFEVGAEIVEITPPVGYPTYHGENRGVNDPLYARALVFKQERSKIAIISCDLIGVTADIVTRTRSLVEKSIGIDADHIMIGATHSHTGPVIPPKMTDIS